VNYHVRQLARGGFLRRAGRRRKRGLIEQHYVVTARAFLLAPGLLGAMEPDARAAADKMSAAYLLTLAAQMQAEAGRAWQESHAAGARMPVLTLDTEIAFASAEQRGRFADALAAAVTRVVAEHTQPADGTAGSGARRFRLALGCYPLPAAGGEAPDAPRRSRDHVSRGRAPRKDQP
jgi:hypothetical protein